MPEISRFLGIVIAVMEIKTLNILAENLPVKVRNLVAEWAELHQPELLEMWDSKDFHKIQPLV